MGGGLAGYSSIRPPPGFNVHLIANDTSQGSAIAEKPQGHPPVPLAVEGWSRQHGAGRSETFHGTPTAPRGFNLATTSLTFPSQPKDGHLDESTTI